jgi:hypothetical protein
VHEHTSAPIGFEDLKAILQRQPGRLAGAKGEAIE